MTAKGVAVVSDKANRTTISILQRTKDALDSIKHPGQSYDGMIQELITLWEEKQRAAESASVEKVS